MKMSGLRLLLFILLISLFRAGTAIEYDPLLLQAQASIFPKIVMLDKQVEEKTVGDEVLLLIVATEEDIPVAKSLQELILQKYNYRLGKLSMSVRILGYDAVNPDSVPTAYILLRGKELFEDVVSKASKKGRIVFSYNYEDFENKALISLYVKEKTYVYLNKSALTEYDVKFMPVFYKIVKILE